MFAANAAVAVAPIILDRRNRSPCVPRHIQNQDELAGRRRCGDLHSVETQLDHAHSPHAANQADQPPPSNPMIKVIANWE